MHTIYLYIYAASPVDDGGGFNWWAKQDARDAHRPFDQQNWATLDVTLPARFDPIYTSVQITTFLNAAEQVSVMEAAIAEGVTSIDFGNR